MSSVLHQPALQTIVERLRQELPRLRTEYSVREIGIFGSYVRNEQTEQSDIDVLVTFDETPGLIKYVTLEQYLTDILHAPVDLVMESALKPSFRDRISGEVYRI